MAAGRMRTIYEPPALRAFTLSGAISKPATRKRSPLNSSASGSPTYPIPTIPMRASRVSILRFRAASWLPVRETVILVIQPQEFQGLTRRSIHAIGHHLRAEFEPLSGRSFVFVSELVLPDYANSKTKYKEISTSASGWRSEEHTSELQSLRHLVCRLL